MSDIVNVKTENLDVRAYVYKMIPKQLNSNPVFVKLFGSNFAHKRLKKNVLSVYTNDISNAKFASGYNSTNDKSIVLCITGKDYKLLTPTDIENNPEIKETLLHECIHAIFFKGKEECQDPYLVSRMGVFDIYYIPETNTISEIGRGLNEGYTEWMCEKAGMQPTAYKTLTNFIRLLEAARGTEQIMAMGNGNLSTVLNISQEDAVRLLGIGDSVYKAEMDICSYELLINSLENNSQADSKVEQTKEAFQVFSPEIEDSKSDVAFLNWVKKQGRDDSNQSLIDYIKFIKIPSLEESMDISAALFESIVLEKYFIADLNQIFEEKPINPQNIDQIEKLISLLRDKKLSGEAKDMCKDMTSIVVGEKFKKLKSRFIEQIAKEDAKSYNESALPLRNVIRRAKKYIGDSYQLKQEYCSTFESNVGLSYSKLIKDLIEAAWYIDEDNIFFEEVEKANIYSIKSKNELGEYFVTSVAYGSNMIIDSSRIEQVVDKNSEGDIHFDYTVARGEDISKVVKQFEALKSDVLTKYPNATIHIAQRAIAIDIGEIDPVFYYILDDDILPMEIKKKERGKICAGDKEQKTDQSMVTIDIKAGRIEKIINGIKRKLFEIKSKKEEIHTVVYSSEIVGKINLYHNSRTSYNENYENLPQNELDNNLQARISKEITHKERMDNDDFER